MYSCPHCGRSLTDDAVYCEGCGNHVAKYGTVQNASQEQVTPKKKGKSIKIFLAGVLVFFIIFLIIGFAVNGNSENPDSGSNSSTTSATDTASSSSNDTSNSSETNSADTVANTSSVNKNSLIGTWKRDLVTGYEYFIFSNEGACISQFQNTSGVQGSIPTTWGQSGTSVALYLDEAPAQWINCSTNYMEFTFSDGALSYVNSENQRIELEKVSDSIKLWQGLAPYLSDFTMSNGYQLSIDPIGTWTYADTSGNVRSSGSWLFYTESIMSNTTADGAKTTFNVKDGAIFLFSSTGELTNVMHLSEDGILTEVEPEK